MLTVQWHAALTLQSRPSSIDSKAPRWMSPGAESTLALAADHVTIGWTTNS
jgi:hypothetical protein